MDFHFDGVANRVGFVGAGVGGGTHDADERPIRERVAVHQVVAIHRQARHNVRRRVAGEVGEAGQRSNGGRTVTRQRVGRDADAVDVLVAGQHRVLERQNVGAAAGLVPRWAGAIVGGEREVGRALDLYRIIERGGDADCVARFVSVGRIVVAGVRIGRYFERRAWADRARRNSVDPVAGEPPHVPKRAIGGVAGAVLDVAAAERAGAGADRYAVVVLLVAPHGVAEHQARRAAAAVVRRLDGCGADGQG